MCVPKLYPHLMWTKREKKQTKLMHARMKLCIEYAEYHNWLNEWPKTMIHCNVMHGAWFWVSYHFSEESESNIIALHTEFPFISSHLIASHRIATLYILWLLSLGLVVLSLRWFTANFILIIEIPRVCSRKSRKPKHK